MYKKQLFGLREAALIKSKFTGARLEFPEIAHSVQEVCKTKKITCTDPLSNVSPLQTVSSWCVHCHSKSVGTGGSGPGSKEGGVCEVSTGEGPVIVFVGEPRWREAGG